MADAVKVGLVVPRFEAFTDFYLAADQMGFPLATDHRYAVSSVLEP